MNTEVIKVDGWIFWDLSLQTEPACIVWAPSGACKRWGTLRPALVLVKYSKTRIC